VVDGVVHYCVANMPGAVARTSTFALNNATLPFTLGRPEQNFTRHQRTYRGNPRLDTRRSAEAPDTGRSRAECTSSAGKRRSNPTAAGASELDHERDRFDGGQEWGSGTVCEVRGPRRRERTCIGGGHRNRNRLARYRPDIQSVVYDKIGRYGDGPVDLPFDHRSPWWPVVGCPEQTRRRRLSVYAARRQCEFYWRFKTRAPDGLPPNVRLMLGQIIGDTIDHSARSCFVVRAQVCHRRKLGMLNSPGELKFGRNSARGRWGARGDDQSSTAMVVGKPQCPSSMASVSA
jgi:Alanine dehydrogenase/PNT, C-terminal domain